MSKRRINKLLKQFDLKFEDVYEPDLKKQYENYKILCYLLGDEPLPEAEARKRASAVGCEVRR